MTENSRVLVGFVDREYVVRVIGKGTMEYCSDLFNLLSDKIEKKQLDTLYIELSETVYLDSSFIGVIVSIQKRLKQTSPESAVILLNPSEKVRDILNTMGLMEIVPVQNDREIRNMVITEEIRKKLDKTYKDIQLLLESHQNLMEISGENRKKFSLVEEMLKKELERQKNEQHP